MGEGEAGDGGCFVFASLALLNATVNNSHSNRDIGIVSRTCVSVLPTQCVRIHASTANDDDLRSITVRPWFDMVTDLEAQTFAKDTPPQRQQLILDGKRLKDDGRVLALHGVVAECTIQLVSRMHPPPATSQKGGMTLTLTLSLTLSSALDQHFFFF